MKTILLRTLQSIAGRIVCPFMAALQAVGTVVGVASAANSLFGGDKSAPDTGAARDAADKSGKYYDTLAGISQDQWDLFKNEGLPLLRTLSTKAQQDRTSQVTEAAAGDTKSAFGAARNAARRDLNLTVGDNSDRAAAVLGPSYMDEAARVGSAITAARTGEQSRQFNEPMQVLNTYRGFPAAAASGLGAAGAGEQGIAGTDAYLANSAAQRQAQGAYGGVLLARNAQSWGAGPAATGNTNPGGNYVVGSPTSYGNTYSLDDPAYGADGGVLRGRSFARKGYADGGDVSGGVIRGPGTGTSDSIATKSRPGSFILSADTVRAIGTKKVHEMIEKSGVRPGEGGTSYSGVPVRVSNGEAEIPPETVRYHGEDFFHKLQQKYHRPVMADDDGKANGGAIRKRGLPRSVEDAIFRAMPTQAIGGRG